MVPSQYIFAVLLMSQVFGEESRMISEIMEVNLESQLLAQELSQLLAKIGDILVLKIDIDIVFPAHDSPYYQSIS